MQKLPDTGICALFLGDHRSYCFLIPLCNRNLKAWNHPSWCLIRIAPWCTDCDREESGATSLFVCQHPRVNKGCDSSPSGPLVCSRAAPFLAGQVQPSEKPRLSVTVCRKCLNRQPDADAKTDLLPSGRAGLRCGLYRTGRPRSQH